MHHNQSLSPFIIKLGAATGEAIFLQTAPVGSKTEGTHKLGWRSMAPDSTIGLELSTELGLSMKIVYRHKFTESRLQINFLL